jgi:hypothetical protein
VANAWNQWARERASDAQSVVSDQQQWKNQFSIEVEDWKKEFMLLRLVLSAI